MAGLILGAMGGAGQAAQRVGENMQRGAIQADLEQLRSENDLNRAKALEQFKMEVGNTQRTQTAERIGEAKRGIINTAIDEKYAKPVMGDTPLTPEQQAVFDQGMETQSRDIAKDRKAMDEDVKTDVRAALKTGDLSVKDAALLSQKDAADETRLRIAEMRVEALNAKTEAQAEAARAKLEAAIAKAGNGNTDFDKKIKLLKEAGATPKEIANFITERKQPSLEELASGFLKADKFNEMTPEDAMAKAKALRSLTQTLGDEAPAGGKPEAQKPAAKQDVRVGGRVIGQAATEEEARALVSEYLKGGKTVEHPEKAPVDSLRGAIIGPLTPMHMIEESAEAGNKEAIEYLNRRRVGMIQNETGPRTAAEMLNY